MPTYEYRCDNGHLFERTQKMSDKPISKCPECGAPAARIISGGQGVIFKGSGFYITDYGKDGKGPRKDATASSESSGSSAPAPAEGAPAKKAEPAATPPSKPDAK